MRYLLLSVFLFAASCSKENAAQPGKANPPANAATSVTTTFEKLIDGDIPTGEFTFIARYDSSKLGKRTLRDYASAQSQAMIKGVQSNSYKFILVKQGIQLPDAADGDKILITAIKDSAPSSEDLLGIIAVKITRP